MKHITLLVFGAAISLFSLRPAFAAGADCLLDKPTPTAETVEYAGKTYYLRDRACKDEFLADPERFSQLFDTLRELQASGQTPKKSVKPKTPDMASLVPS